jgi:archaellum component FlaC
MATNFQLKNYLDTLIHTEINSIYAAINNIEYAIDIDSGTGKIILSDSSISSLDASKLIPTSDASIRNISLSGTFDVAGNAAIDGILTFGSSGGIKIHGVNDIEIIKLGEYNTGLHGLLCTDGTNVNLLVDNNGHVTVRGNVNALTGSQFTGTVTVESGNILGDVNVGGSTGIVLKGGTKELVIGSLGKIVAGTNELTSSSFSFNQGTINIGTKFSVDSTGKLTATDVDITGKVAVSSGDFELYAGIVGGAQISLNGIYVNGFGSSTAGWSLDRDGFLYAKKASVTGEVNITSGTITGIVEMSGQGQLVLPGVTFTPTGPSFSILNLSLGGGKFNLNNGNLQCTNAIVTGQINMTSGNVVGTVTIGGDPNLKFNGSLRQITAGNSVISSSGISFKHGSICLGSGIFGPVSDEAYRLYLSNDGYLAAKDVYLEGEFVGSLIGTNGSLGGWLIDSSSIFAENTSDSYPSGTAGEINRSLFILSGGVLATYADRLALGGGHADTLALRIDKDGLYIPNGKIDITTGFSEGKKVVINSTGIRAQETISDEVVIDGSGIRVFSNGADLGYIITPTGLEPSALKDNSLTAIKFNSTAPKTPTNLIHSVELKQTHGHDTAEAVVSWTIPTEKEDDSPYTDPACFRIYIKDVEVDAGFPCVFTTDHKPDFPEIVDPEDPNYNVKSFRISNLRTGTVYSISVSAVDRLGNESTKQETAISTPKDQSIPSPSATFVVTPLVRMIVGVWNRAQEKDFLYYEIERAESFDDITYTDWQPLTTVKAEVLVDLQVYVTSWYKYRIRTVDRDLHESPWMEMSYGIQPLEVTGDLLADDITISGHLKLNTPGIDLNMWDDFLAVYGVEEIAVTPYEPTTPVDESATPDEDSTTPEEDSTPTTPTTPTTPLEPIIETIRVPKGLAAKNLYVGGNYNDWHILFASSSTPMFLDGEPGNAYFARNVWIHGLLEANAIAAITVCGVDIPKLRIDADWSIENIGILQSEVSSIQQEISALKTTDTMISGNIAIIESTINTIQSDIADINLHIEDIDNDINSINLTVHGIQPDIANLQSRMSTSEANIADLQNAMSTAQQDIDVAEANISTIQEEVAELSNIINDHIINHPNVPSITITRQDETVGAGGIAAGTNHIIPGGKRYVLGSNTLQVFLDGRLMSFSEYSEVDENTISFLLDIPQGSQITYIIFNV